ncbi:MAG: hypothetical protein L3J82_08620 [Planctomycetes bacterium]|nr:hypothetical protein [Planctomycetota bacterium]
MSYQLVINGERIVPVVDEVSIRRALTEMSAHEDEFVVLMRDDEHYLQTSMVNSEKVVLEAHEELDFEQAIVPSIDGVVEAFQAYARGEDEWREDFVWLEEAAF